MKSNKLFFQECHLAGRKYHDADEVWQDLQVGTLVSLEREQDNPYDKNAVQIVYSRTDEETGKQEKFLLGYIPRNENQTISALLEMGWTQLFECRISQMDPSAYYEEQIHIVIKLRRNEEVSN